MVALRRVQVIKAAAGWAPVAWFPMMLVALSFREGFWAAAIGIAGVVFAGMLRVAVLMSRCPGCGERYAVAENGYREIWLHDKCGACGLLRYPN